MHVSEVFRNMFDAGLRESQQSSVTLSQASGTSVQLFVEYLHKGYLPRGSNSRELAELAHMYEMEHLLALCLKDILSKVCVQTVGEIARMLQMYSTATPEASRCWEMFVRIVRCDQDLVDRALELLGRD